MRKTAKVVEVLHNGHAYVVIQDLTGGMNPYKLYDKWRGFDGRKHSRKMEEYADLRSCLYWIAGAIA